MSQKKFGAFCDRKTGACACQTGSTYQALLRLLPLCDEKSLSALVAAATVLAGADQDATPNEQLRD